MSSTKQSVVSVVVPVYNAADYLSDCLESILSQSYEALELICVNDGSTDDSLVILEQYADRDRRVRVITQENAGPGVARNVGMKHASGEYLYFFDSDDWCAPTLLEKSVSALEEAQADFVIIPFFQFDQRVGEPLFADWCPVRGKFEAPVFSWTDNPDWIFSAFGNFPWNRLYRKSFVDENSLRFQEIYLTEDLMFSAPALVKAKRITCLDEPLLYHREGTNENTMAYKDSHPLDFLTAFLSLREYLEREGIFEPLKVAFVDHAVSGCVYNLHTLRTYEGFTLVFDELTAKGGLARLGAFEIEPAQYLNDFPRRFVANITSLKKDDYLYLLYDESCRDREYSFYRSRLLSYVENDLAERSRQLDSITREYEALLREHAELKSTHNAIMGAAEQKVGQAICFVPRAIQRWIIRNRKKR